MHRNEFACNRETYSRAPKPFSGKEALPRLPRGYKLKNNCAGPTVAESGACVKGAVFGPILPILTYKSLDEGFARIAARPRPLAGFIFSRDQKTIERFIGELSYDGAG